MIQIWSANYLCDEEKIRRAKAKKKNLINRSSSSKETDDKNSLTTNHDNDNQLDTAVLPYGKLKWLKAKHHGNGSKTKAKKLNCPPRALYHLHKRF